MAVESKAHRPIITGRHGMASTGHSLASFEAVHVLKKGGNAMDAALAAAGVLSVIKSYHCGLGGGKAKSGVPSNSKGDFRGKLSTISKMPASRLKLRSPWDFRMGGAEGILMDPNTGVFQGGADPRRNGYAIGY